MYKLDLKGRGTRDQTANIRWITEKAKELQKNIYFCFTDITPMAERERELKSLLIKVKEIEKADLKFNIKKNLRLWHPVPSLHGKEMGGVGMETIIDFILLGSKTTADGDSSHDVKICLLLGIKL